MDTYGWNRCERVLRERRFAPPVMEHNVVLRPEAPPRRTRRLLMNKWLTRFVLAVTAVILAMMPVKLNIRDADSVLGRSLRQSDDRVVRTEPTCGGWDGRPCNEYDEIGSPAVRDGLIEEAVARWLDHWGGKGRGAVRRGLKRMGRYEDYIAAELAAREPAALASLSPPHRGGLPAPGRFSGGGGRALATDARDRPVAWA